MKGLISFRLMKKQTLHTVKKTVGYKAANLVEDGMVIGLGTGSTVFFVMERLHKRIKSGLTICGVPTSHQTAFRAYDFGIPLTSLDEHPILDLTIDGADQVDPKLQLIKGRGAAHTREKCVANAAKQFIVVIDSSKMTSQLDAAVPIEVIPFAVTPVIEQLKRMGGKPVLREGIKKDGPILTDNGNFVIDCAFGVIKNPSELEKSLACIPGVIENGLFTQFTEKTIVIVGEQKKCRILKSTDVIT